MSQNSNPKVAIVCDWLVGLGGAERVVFALHQMFPEAPIYTSNHNPEAVKWSRDADVRTSKFLQRLPFGLRKFLPIFRAWYFSHLNLSGYDLVISSSGAEAKSVKTGSNTTHICYCHAPTHYYWMRYESYLEHPGFGKFNWLARLGLKILVGPMRKWDKKAAKRPDYLIANSNFTRAEIKKYYGRDSVVIHPPVDIERFIKVNKTNQGNFLVVGRQAPYKRIDLAILACKQLGLPLAIVGDGPEHKSLLNLAGSSANFVTDASDAKVVDYMCSAKALIFPTDREDFGITPVESLAAGTPVIAFNGGGVVDSIKEGKTGLLFNSLTVDSLSSKLKEFNPRDYDGDVLKKAAEKFSGEEFRGKMKEFINKVKIANTSG